jgi:hypothetical protein
VVAAGFLLLPYERDGISDGDEVVLRAVACGRSSTSSYRLRPGKDAARTVPTFLRTEHLGR